MRHVAFKSPPPNFSKMFARTRLVRGWERRACKPTRWSVANALDVCCIVSRASKVQVSTKSRKYPFLLYPPPPFQPPTRLPRLFLTHPVLALGLGEVMSSHLRALVGGGLFSGGLLGEHQLNTRSGIEGWRLVRGLLPSPMACAQLRSSSSLAALNICSEREVRSGGGRKRKGARTDEEGRAIYGGVG